MIRFGLWYAVRPLLFLGAPPGGGKGEADQPCYFGRVSSSHKAYHLVWTTNHCSGSSQKLQISVGPRGLTAPTYVPTFSGALPFDF